MTTKNDTTLSRISGLLLSLACLCSCATIRVYSADAAAPALVKKAGESLGVRTLSVQKPGRGVVKLRIEPIRVDPATHRLLCGTAESRVVSAKSVLDALEHGVLACQPEAWACPDAEAVAHELGHVFGLNHTKKGLMAPVLNGDSSLTRAQQAIVSASALMLERVCK